MEVTIQNKKLQSFRPISFSDEVAEVGYTALCYPMDSAVVLAEEAGFVPGPAPAPGRKYTLEDRRSISEYFLRFYCSATRRDGNPDRTEYIWLDEFCLSNDQENDGQTISKQRDVELGRLADVFRGAIQVAVFCHEPNCEHTSLACLWGNRLFTIPEILHTETVLRLTRKRQGNEMVAKIFRTTGRAFREAMEKNAAEGKRWHLNAIYRHTVNAGAVPWQVAIHALVVECIRRDEAGRFDDHKYLGKALNGLLPRRARLSDLGNGGWKDLAWLLELNQGFYNAASLAAVCSISEDNSVAWLGKPIDPGVGNERLEPIVTAFPVASDTAPPLTIIAGEMLGLRPTPLKRDAFGLYNNEEIKAVKLLAVWGAVALFIVSTVILVSGNINVGFILYYVISILYCIVEMVIGTMYLQRDGWAFLEDSMWGDKLEVKLGEQDNNLRSLTHWGARQLVPQWEFPRFRPSFTGKLVDLRHRVYTETIVVSRPNAMIPLAIHGGGVTCMLLERPENSEKEPSIFGTKTGMVNLPPYIFSQMVKGGTIYVGNSL
jgi:hypothetical protein